MNFQNVVTSQFLYHAVTDVSMKKSSCCFCIYCSCIFLYIRLHHKLYLMFASEQCWQWSGFGRHWCPTMDHSVMVLEFFTVTVHHREVEPCWSSHHRPLMGPVLFLRELGIFPKTLFHDSVEGLITAWGGQVTGWILPTLTVCVHGFHKAPWFSEWLRKMKRHEKCQDCGWPSAKTYFVMIKVTASHTYC